MRSFPIVLLLLISYLSKETEQTSYRPVYDKLPPEFGENRHHNEISSRHTIHNNLEPAFRMKRAENDLTTIHSKLTLAARVFSGIATRVGIHDGSITGDQFISEMLNFDDSVNLDDVENFDKAKVDQFFQDLKGLSMTTDMDDFENKVETMNSLREKYGTISSTKDKTAIDEFVGKVETFPDLNVKFQDLKMMGNTMTSALSDLSIINEYGATTLKKVKLNSLETDLTALAKLSTEVETALQTLNNHKDLIGRKILDSPMLQNVELLARYEDGLAKLVAITDSSTVFESVLNTISAISSDFDGVLPYLNVIQQIGSLQSVSKIPTGFINGFSDVIKLSSDVQDSWLPNTINKYDKELIKSELKPLEQFKTSYLAVESQWKQLSDSDAIPIIRTIASTFNESTTVHDKTAIGEISSRALPGVTKGFSGDLMGFVGKMLKFRETLLMLIAKLTTISKLDKLKTLESQVQFKDKIDFTNSRTLQQVKDDMPKKGELGTLIQDVNTLKPFFEEFKKILDDSDLTKLAGDIKNEKNAVDTFLADTSTIAFFKYCEDLKKMKSDLESLSKAVTLIRTIRKIQNDANFSDKLSGVTQKISGPIQDFKTLRAVPDAIKSIKTPRIDELILLKKIQNSSRILGEAVAVLDTAHSIVSMKTEIRHLIKKGWDVNGTISSVPTPALKKQLLKDWKPFVDFAVYFESLISTLETSMSSVSRIRRRGVSELEEYASRLSSLNTLPDFKIDLLPMMTVLDKLPTLQSRDQMLTTMRKIQNLDLQFSAHSSALTSVGSSATSTVNLFSNVKPAATGNTPGVGDPRNDPNSKNGSGNLKTAGGNAGKESDDNDGTVVVVVGFGFVAVVAVIAVLVWFCWRRLNKKVPPPTPDVDLEAGTHPKPDSTTTASSAAQSPAPPAAPAPEKPKDSKNEEEKKVPEEPKEAKAENKPTEHVPDPSEKPTEKGGDATTTEDTRELTTTDLPIDASRSLIPLKKSKKSKRSRALDKIARKQRELAAEFLKQFDKEAQRKQLDERLKNAEPQQKESLEKQFREVTDQLHAINKSIEQLSKGVDPGVVIDAKKDASIEYEQATKMIDEMPARIDANQVFDQQWAVLQAKNDFNFMSFVVLNEVETIRDAWNLDKGTFVYTPTRRLVVERLQFIESRLLTYEPKREVLVKWFEQNKGLPRKMTLALAPYMLRLEWVNRMILNEVEENVLKFDEHRKRDPKVDFDSRIYFDHSRYRLRNNRTLNIAVFNMPYGEQIFLCNAPQTEEEKDELLQMMVEGRVGFAYSFADEWDEWKDTTNCKVWVDAKADLSVEQNILRANLPKGRTTITGTVKKYNVQNRATHEKTLVTRFTSSEWTRDAVPLTSGFRKRVFQILIHMTRHKNQRVLLIDDKIGSRSSAFLLAEYISSQVSTYGTLSADLTTNLLALSKHRSQLFVDPDLVMFGAYLAVNRILLEHDRVLPLYNKERYYAFENRWKDFETCRDKKIDDAKKKKNFPNHAKLMEIDADELPTGEEAKTQEETLTSTAKE